MYDGLVAFRPSAAAAANAWCSASYWAEDLFEWYAGVKCDMFDRLGCLAAAKKEGECLAETQSAKGTKRRKGTWRGRIESGRNVEDGRLASHSSPQRCRSVPTATTRSSTVHLHEK